MKDPDKLERLSHQGADVNVSAIRWIVLAFVVILALIHAGVWWLFRYVRIEDERRDVRRTFVETQAPVPPEPRLQVNPQEDLQEYLRMQKQTLSEYAWISRPDGRIRIPIERAMELVREQE